MRPQPSVPALAGLPPPLPQASLALPSVRFRLDRTRQPELLRQLEEMHPPALPASPFVRSKQLPKLKPYQLNPRRGQETFIEPPVKQKGYLLLRAQSRLNVWRKH